MKRIIFFFAVLVLLAATACAQSALNIENVYQVTLRNQGAIITNHEVKGYFLFYISDKVDKKNNEYTLQILDENLNKVKDIRFTDSKNVLLLEACFNGTNLMFEFFDTEEKSLTYKSFDFTGKQVAIYSRELDKRTYKFFADQINLNKEETENRSLFPVEGKGFLSVIPVRDEDKDYSYEVNYYKGDTRGQWTFNPESDDKYEQPQFLGCSDSVAVMQVTHKKSLMGGKYESWLMGINLFNGRQVFNYQTETKDKYNFLPMNVSTIQGENGFVLSGSYFNADDNVIKDKSLGIGMWVMDNKGNIIKSKYDSWETDLAKYMNVGSNGKVEDIGYLYFHTIIRTADNKIFAVAEGYKKQASAGGIAASVAMAALGGRSGVAMVKLHITDLVILEFDKDFTLKKATTYDKGDNNISLPSGAGYLGPQTLAYMVKYLYDGFDYSYAQIPEDRSGFVIGYSDAVKEEGYKGATFNTITYKDGNFTNDKLNLKTSASSMVVLPGKTGSVAIVEYFKKEKKMVLHIEKMN